jgi:hypothetical protein
MWMGMKMRNYQIVGVELVDDMIQQYLMVVAKTIEINRI